MRNRKTYAVFSVALLAVGCLFAYSQGKMQLMAQFVPSSEPVAAAPAVAPETAVPAVAPTPVQPAPQATATPILSYFPKASPTPAVQATPGGSPAAADPEQDARERVSRAKADSRSMATAMEAYFVDNNTYPPSLFKLTSPIAYITGIPKDPFSAQNDDPKAQISRNTWLIYSVGPDKKDDRGLINYDPTNGTFSKGDIIRIRQ